MGGPGPGPTGPLPKNGTGYHLREFCVNGNGETNLSLLKSLHLSVGFSSLAELPSRFQLIPGLVLRNIKDGISKVGTVLRDTMYKDTLFLQL